MPGPLYLYMPAPKEEMVGEVKEPAASTWRERFRSEKPADRLNQHVGTISQLRLELFKHNADVDKILAAIEFNCAALRHLAIFMREELGKK